LAFTASGSARSDHMDIHDDVKTTMFSYPTGAANIGSMF
jgi:hypothetical protein